MARIVNPYNLGVEDDDALFAGALSQGLIWIEDDDDEEDGFESYLKSKIEYLDTSHQTKARVLQGHRKRVNALEVQGDNIFSASEDRTICVWNWNTGDLVQTLRGHKRGVKSLAISGDFVISASDDKTVRIGNWVTGTHVRTLDGYSHEVSRLAIDGDTVASVSHNEIWIWN
jgi:WD40 repeat protein